MENGLTEEELLNVIAFNIAKNQCSYESKSEEEKKDLFPKVQMVADSQVTELKRNFDAVLNSVGVDVVPEMKLELLIKVKDKVKENGISSFSDVFATGEMINYISNEAIMVEQRIQENMELTDEIKEAYLFSGIEMEFSEIRNYTMANGIDISIEEPEDSRFSCTIEQLEEDMKILLNQEKLQDLNDKFDRGAISYEEGTKGVDSILEQKDGADAIFGDIEAEFDDGRGIEYLTQNALGKYKFKALVRFFKRDSAENVGFKDDNYAIFKKLKMFSQIKEAYRDGKLTDSEFEEFEEGMKDIDSELYDLLEKNPSLMEMIQKDNFDENDVNTNSSINLAIKFVGNSASITREETFLRLREYVRNNPECQQEPVGNVPKPKPKEIVIEEPPIRKPFIPLSTNEKTPRDIVENNKGLMLRCYRERGIETVLSALAKNSTAEQLSLSTRTAWLETITELLQQENLGTEESIIRTEEDWRILKEHLKKVCTEEKTHKYAQKLGIAVKEISDSEREKKIFEVGSVKEIIESFAETQISLKLNRESEDESR